MASNPFETHKPKGRTISLSEYTKRFRQHDTAKISRTTSAAMDAGGETRDELMQDAGEQQTGTVDKRSTNVDDHAESEKLLGSHDTTDAMDMDWEESQEKEKAVHSSTPVPHTSADGPAPTEIHSDAATKNLSTALQDNITAPSSSLALTPRPQDDHSNTIQEEYGRKIMNDGAANELGLSALPSPAYAAASTPSMPLREPSAPPGPEQVVLSITDAIPQVPPAPLAPPFPQELPPPLAQYHQKLQLAQQHKNVVRWKPQSPGDLPQTDKEYFDYISQVIAALSDVTQALDRERPCLANFGPGGTYTHQDIECRATILIYQAVRLYQYGATSLSYKSSLNLPRKEDAELSFNERVEAFVKLLKDYKQAADDVMCGRMQEEYLSAPNASWLALNDDLTRWSQINADRRMVALSVALQDRLHGNDTTGLPYTPATAVPAYNAPNQWTHLGRNPGALHGPSYGGINQNYPPQPRPTTVGQNSYPSTQAYPGTGFSVPRGPQTAPMVPGRRDQRVTGDAARGQHHHPPSSYISYAIPDFGNTSGNTGNNAAPHEQVDAATSRRIPAKLPGRQMGPPPLPRHIQRPLPPQNITGPPEARNDPSSFTQPAQGVSLGAPGDRTINEFNPAERLRNIFGPRGDGRR